MNFNYGMNFNVRQAKVERKKPEEGVKGKGDKPEEAKSPKAAPETAVLTGNATEIQAAINKATVQGAMGATATQQVEGDRSFLADMQEYFWLKDQYLNFEPTFGPEVNAHTKYQMLLNLQTKIEEIVNKYCEGGYNPQDIIPEPTKQELFNDYNNWANEINIVKQQFPQPNLGPMEDLFRSLDEDHHALNPQFVYDMMEPGIGRVNYFMDKVQEYQDVLTEIDTVSHDFISENGFGAFQVYNQECIQWLNEFNARLAEAQQYLELAKNDLPSAGDEIYKVEQNQSEK